jgi:hypothetical protein
MKQVFKNNEYYYPYDPIHTQMLAKTYDLPFSHPDVKHTSLLQFSYVYEMNAKDFTTTGLMGISPVGALLNRQAAHKASKEVQKGRGWDTIHDAIDPPARDQNKRAKYTSDSKSWL